MATKDRLLRLKCATCKVANYYTTKNKKTAERKLELKKYCKKCNKSTVHKEIKITGK